MVMLIECWYIKYLLDSEDHWNIIVKSPEPNNDVRSALNKKPFSLKGNMTESAFQLKNMNADVIKCRFDEVIRGNYFRVDSHHPIKSIGGYCNRMVDHYTPQDINVTQARSDQNVCHGVSFFCSYSLYKLSKVL